ncbi:hypothetical protein K503DRAFT_675442, partial [Rhizopogon vinicolor AM-OR11-026]
MTEFVRRLVSGGKARFRDPDLDLELDLAYVTDQVIVMGFPSAGLEGFYRNRREDAQRFLTSRHGKDFWVFNFCPTRENFYDKSVFEGRVSRYPFPDHHAPPLAILSLVSREMHAWLAGSKDRVAILHCKAGKGRSGTLACAYLLSLDTFPPLSSPESSNFAKDWVAIRVDDCMQVIPDDATHEELGEGAVSPTSESAIGDEGFLGAPEENQNIPCKPPAPVLQQVLDLHTSRRMKASSIVTKTSSSRPRKEKSGVSIPSQRRWLLYWSRLLAGQGPPGMWGLSDMQSGLVNGSYSPSMSLRKVRITEVSLRMRELSGIKTSLVRAASLLIDRGRDGLMRPGNDRVWASLARYDDELVGALESWEQRTRDTAKLGRRKQSSESVDDIFSNDKWDKKKMVQTFGRMGEAQKLALEPNSSDENTKVHRYILHSLPEERWMKVREAPYQAEEVHNSETSVTSSEMTSIRSQAESAERNVSRIRSGIVVDSDRELRIKLYMGQVLMTWMWLIPSFHIASEMPSSSVVLARNELDFPIGIGRDILDVEVKMEWCRDE